MDPFVSHRGVVFADLSRSVDRVFLEELFGLHGEGKECLYAEGKGARTCAEKAALNSRDLMRRCNGIDYYLMDPTGNITILVVSPVPIPDQPDIADMLMRREPSCEQVGYISASDNSDIRLRMAGGEFCGNATMSTAALFCHRSGIAADHAVPVSVEASGCDSPVPVDITRVADARGRTVFRGRVRMPKHRRVSRHALTFKGRTFDLPVVDVGGIVHIVATEPLSMSDGETEEAIKKWRLELGAEALGIMQVTLYAGDIMALRPLVYVPTAGTCYWERSCASGTAALGLCLADQGFTVSGLPVREPGGALTISEQDGRIVLEGTVEIE